MQKISMAEKNAMICLLSFWYAIIQLFLSILFIKLLQKYLKRIVLKIIFISVCHQENEVFHKSFASLFQKRVEFELQNVQWTFVLQRPKRSWDQGLKVFLLQACFWRGSGQSPLGKLFTSEKSFPILKKCFFIHFLNKIYIDKIKKWHYNMNIHSYVYMK